MMLLRKPIAGFATVLCCLFLSSCGGSDSGVLTKTQSGTYILSGDGPNNAMMVDDDLGVWLNGKIIYYDVRTKGAGPKGPFSFAGKTGDQLRIQVQNWYPSYAGINSNTYLTAPNGIKTEIIPKFFEPESNNEAIVFDKTFTLP